MLTFLLPELQGGPTIMACNVQRKGIRPWRQVQQQQRRRRRQERQQREQQQLYTRLRDAAFKIKQPTAGTTKVAKAVRGGTWGTKGTSSGTTATTSRATTTNVALSLLLLLLLSSKEVANAEGNVGCHFVKTLCLVGSEVCFDDNIFGKCIPTTGVDVEDIEQTPLTEDQSRILATMLEEMQGAGLGWDHPFVQCRIQGALYSLQKQTLLPPNLCANLAPNPEVMDPSSSMAFVRFTPPNENYAEQRHQQPYYGPLKKPLGSFLPHRQLRHDPSELAHFGSMDYPHQPAESSASLMAGFLQRERERIQSEQRERELEADRELAAKNQQQLYQMFAASEPDPEPFERHPVAPVVEAKERGQEDERESVAVASPVLTTRDHEDSNEMYFPENYAVNFKRTNDGTINQQLLEYPEPKQRESYFRQLELRPGVGSWKANGNALITKQRDNPMYKLPLESFSDKDYRSNELEDAEDDDDNTRTLYEKRLLHNSLTPIEEEAILTANAYPAVLKQRTQQPDDVYTEGGRIFVPQLNRKADAYDEAVKKEEARFLLENMLGFTRHERLDVKKPGPLIRPPQPQNTDAKATSNNTSKAAKEQQTKELLPQSIKNNSQLNKEKKVVKDHSDEDHAPHIVDTEYAHVFVRNAIDSWSDGVRIVNELANILHMQGYFAYLTVQPHEVSFRVDSNNPERKTATDVARIINDSRGVRNNILRRLGVIVTGAGVGDKIKRIEDGGVSSARIELAEQGPDMTHIMAYMFAGAGAAAVIVIFVTLTLIKRHDKKRDKLSSLQTSTVAAESCSKDYQELCRARMAGKTTGGPEPANSGRIMTLSKDSERPPSSRSSTSSWSEEPALTNMDISTGHMVLSYMEDHLRNKGRLQREWEALCRYEAEPSASEAALQPECSTLNRAGAPLPFDHSRVVLNYLANAEGLDYINASTITDHDPRTPAYIAAQGPLPTTLAHFWQMIWEQGAVVIVDLCRLQENGDIACVRYWPEEGAEVYHFYEVHLVSEHIWCDDYLVRSFYLKNLRTGDTRTVTQFHFLSWPQGGVPAQPKALLDFRRKVNKSYRGRSCPIVVHSSAGAGRTGAYILLDLVLGRMNKGAREIDIAATLEHLRDQRAGMVATRQQFEFVLMAVAEEVHAILKALPANTSNEKRELEDKKEATLKEEHESVAESEADPATASQKEKSAKMEDK